MENLNNTKYFKTTPEPIHSVSNVLEEVYIALKEKGYKCGFIWTQEGWSHNHYTMKVSWKKIK